MTVGILTLHRCINYGSYWQARCLAEAVAGMGHAAMVLDHRTARIRRAELRCALDPLQPAGASAEDRAAYGRKARRFVQAQEALPLSAPFDLDAAHEAPATDVLLVGSDEVWNLHHPWYAACPPLFGCGLPALRRVAYAASCGGYPAQDGLPGRWAQALRAFDTIAVRDANTRALLQPVLGHAPPVVLDPCLAFGPPAALPPPAHPLAADGAVLVYGHHFSPAMVEGARRWARARGLRLLSIGYRNDWADAQWLEAGPLAFASAIAHAGAVVTNFFHGCVFALGHGKPFVAECMPYRALKVTQLLSQLGACAHHAPAGASAEAVQTALQSPSPAVQARIGRLRARSRAFLARTLAGTRLHAPA